MNIAAKKYLLYKRLLKMISELKIFYTLRKARIANISETLPFPRL